MIESDAVRIQRIKRWLALDNDWSPGDVFWLIQQAELALRYRKALVTLKTKYSWDLVDGMYVHIGDEFISFEEYLDSILNEE